MADIPHSRHDASALDQLLHEKFALAAFRPGQEQVIHALLANQSALAVFPTGSGKSLCYQLPALCFDGLTLVVSPLIALMKDQVEKLRRHGIGAARIDSSLADDEINVVFEHIANGDICLLFLSPERLASSAFRKRLKGVPLPLIAIDEAHCISEWGHNFRPDYLKIAKIARQLKVARVLTLTATATPPVMRDIRRNFRIAKEHCFLTGIIRPNLHLNVTLCATAEKFTHLIERLHEIDGPVIVYATTRHDTEAIATQLIQHGFSAASYHAGLTQDLRNQTQDAFMRNQIRIIVATIAFGMGIDKPDIRSVIHYHLPKCLEGYSQETGRAGRDGMPAHCEMLASIDDTLTLENFIHGSTPSTQTLKNMLDRILRLSSAGRMFAVSLYELSISHDMRQETVRTVLAYLELDGIIHRHGSYHDDFRIRLLRPEKSILAGRPPREKSLVKKLLAYATPAYGSLRINLYETAEYLHTARDKIAQLVRDLAESGDIRVEQRGLREVYQTNKSWDGNTAAVIASMTHRFASMAEREHERIRTVVAYVQARGCRAAHLAKHFGHRGTAACGTCDHCRGSKPLRMPALRMPSIPYDQWAAMAALRQENHPSLATPKQLARFLCGIPSPAARRAKLQQRPEFALWRDHRFADILAMLEA